MAAYMPIEFGSEVPQCRGIGVETQLTMATQGTCLHVLSNVPHENEIIRSAFQKANPLEYLEQVTHTHPTWKALSAGFVLAKGD